MAILQTFATVGIREELSDKIWDISPEKTPFTSGAMKGTVKNTLSEWQIDELAAPDDDNAFVQGFDVSSEEAVSQPSRLGNRTQISAKTAKVAKTVEATDRAGRKGEMARAIARKTAELKRDIETILLSNQAADAGDATNASYTGSVLAFIKSNVNKAGDGANPSYTTLPDDPRGDGTQRAYSEVIHKNVLEQMWVAGAEPDRVMVNAFQKQVASTFTGIAQIRKSVEGAKQATVIGAADVYVGDFGQVTFVPNRFMRTRDALYLDSSMYKFSTLRPLSVTPLAVVGSSDRRLIEIEYMLQVMNEKGLGLAADLTDS
jgi:hypothetical protein